MSLFGDSTPIIIDDNVIDPDNTAYQPTELPERQSELGDLNMVIRPVRTGGSPHNALVYGPTGQGKTVGVDLKMNQLKEWAEENDQDISVINVRCKGCGNSYNVLSLLLKQLRETQLGKGIEEPKGYTRKALINMIFEEIDSIGGTVIIVLDEIDGIGEDDYALYELTRPDLEDASVSVIGITNDTQFRQNLDADVQSSLGKREVYFNPYNANQLRDILARRAAGALIDTHFEGEEQTYDNLVSDVLESGVIPLVAALAGDETGDARDAIELFQHTCEYGEANDEMIREDHVRIMQRKLEKNAVREQIEAESTQRKLALASVIKHELDGNDSPGTNEIYKTYCTFTDSFEKRNLSQRTVLQKLNDLNHSNILSKQTRSRGKAKGVSNFYSVAVDMDLAIEALEESPNLAEVAVVLRELQ